MRRGSRQKSGVYAVIPSIGQTLGKHQVDLQYAKFVRVLVLFVLVFESSSHMNEFRSLRT
jgi:hypothetical protein